MGIVGESYTDSVTITHRGTRNYDNSYDYDGTPVNATGRVVYKTGLRRVGTTEEYHFNVVVYFQTPTPIGVGDRLTISSLTYYVRDLNEYYDIFGNTDHYEAICE